MPARNRPRKQPDGFAGVLLKYNGTAIYSGQGLAPVDNPQTLIYVQRGPHGTPLALRYSNIATDGNGLARPGESPMSCFAGPDAEAVYRTFLLEPIDYKPPRELTRREVHLPTDIVEDMQHMASPKIAETHLRKAIPGLIRTG